MLNLNNNNNNSGSVATSTSTPVGFGDVFDIGMRRVGRWWNGDFSENSS